MSDPGRYPSHLADKFMLRLPDGMRDRLAEIAKANGRSMNSEIILRLQASMEGGAVSAGPSPDLQDMAAHARRLNAASAELEAAVGRWNAVVGRLKKVPD